MSDFLGLSYNLVIDRTPREWIGAIGVALVLALLMGGVFVVCRKKVADALTLVIGLMILANVMSMLFAAVYMVIAWNSTVSTDARKHHGAMLEISRPASPRHARHPRS